MQENSSVNYDHQHCKRERGKNERERNFPKFFRFLSDIVVDGFALHESFWVRSRCRGGHKCESSRGLRFLSLSRACQILVMSTFRTLVLLLYSSYLIFFSIEGKENRVALGPVKFHYSLFYMSLASSFVSLLMSKSTLVINAFANPV